MPLPLRDYYPIERAAELLECTVDDLIHWAIIGCIRVYIKIYDVNGKIHRGNSKDIANPENIDTIINETTYRDELYSLDEKNKSRKITEEEEENYLNNRMFIIYNAINRYRYKHGSFECINEIGLGMNYAYMSYFFTGGITERFCMLKNLEKEDDFDENIIPDLDDLLLNTDIEKLSSSHCYSNIVKVSGLVGLGESFFSYGEFRNEFIAPENNSFLPNQVFLPESGLCIEIVPEKNFSFNYDELFIIKNDFISIKEASIDGAELKKVYYKNTLLNENAELELTFNKSNLLNKKYLLNSNTKPHIKAIHIARREEVLKAALHMKVNYPDLCKTHSAWSDAIHDHAHKFWDNGECPLKQETITKMLGKVLNTKKK
ncbi:hypothetical protein IAH56_002373 [Salmonella enterica subsp. enterica serovar Bareilly]|nr:hypothetical protein [Salmonella enterica subsp. enterica serovar Bareilly]